MINPVRFLKAQPRFFTAVAVGAVLWFLLPHGWRGSTRLLVTWDCATGLYLVLAAVMMARSDIGSMRYRAEMQDEGQVAILVLVAVTALISLGGTMAEMAAAKATVTTNGWQHVALACLTVLLSWTFAHTIFAIHYAHEYYEGPEHAPSEGLDFPGHGRPDYWDFLYYAFVIGTACATADVNVTSRAMRRITTLHCAFAFFFNATILALTVNVGAGFF
ncbi:hypothetical protein OJF2_44380 [Aquisphaera giovannonii]|uniref:DUF1345 domain-containing protein n=1 Tax=Aquisphaera giovannonii TaxID=406548 RepID=A0A5B9W788_9BACT|nr:DUF1345 domain-containing protein [Aquisphaera giovannonii]QEH35881.1 hypothetical protein OJF2_44380 [Aquisphaera giovannonii]